MKIKYKYEHYTSCQIFIFEYVQQFRVDIHS